MSQNSTLLLCNVHDLWLLTAWCVSSCECKLSWIGCNQSVIKRKLLRSPAHSMRLSTLVNSSIESSLVAILVVLTKSIINDDFLNIKQTIWTPSITTKKRLCSCTLNIVWTLNACFYYPRQRINIWYKFWYTIYYHQSVQKEISAGTIVL